MKLREVNGVENEEMRKGFLGFLLLSFSFSFLFLFLSPHTNTHLVEEETSDGGRCFCFRDSLGERRTTREECGTCHSLLLMRSEALTRGKRTHLLRYLLGNIFIHL